MTSKTHPQGQPSLLYALRVYSYFNNSNKKLPFACATVARGNMQRQNTIGKERQSARHKKKKYNKNISLKKNELN